MLFEEREWPDFSQSSIVAGSRDDAHSSAADDRNRFVKGYRSSLTRNNKITYSVPYALISTRIETLELGQGLSMGVLNLAIVIPQVLGKELGLQKKTSF